MIELLAGAALGVAGSVHCLAMCGPLVLVAARGAGPRHAAFYHAGRILLYVLLGTIAGLVGSTLALAGLGRVVAVAAGVLLMAGAAAHQQFLNAAAGSRWSAAVARPLVALHRWGSGHPIAGPLATGALNGLLPCGLTYAAVTAAVALGSASAAAAFMAGFGAGTTPALLAFVYTASAAPAGLRMRLKPVLPAALILVGALLIARGLTPRGDKTGAGIRPSSQQGAPGGEAPGDETTRAARESARSPAARPSPPR
jgi:sulfite exporter TauE/SafE